MSKFWGNRIFPYTNLNNINLDWVINCVQELEAHVAEAVRGDIAQNKSVEWKTQARHNIDAASTTDLASLSNELGTLGESVAESVRGDIAQNKSAEWKTRARQNIDAQSASAVIDVEHGGTGSATVADALSALGSTGLLYFGNVGGELVLNFSDTVRFLIVITSTAESRQGAAIVYCGRNSAPIISPIGTLGSAITLTGGTSSLTVTMSTSASATSASILCLSTPSYSRITAGQTNSLSMLSEGQLTSHSALVDGEKISPAALDDGEIINPSASAEE